jgi:hypothetical protein
VLAPQEPAAPNAEARNRRRERRLWEQPKLTPSLGCISCPQRGPCGGLHRKADGFDCMANCCGEPVTCSRVCRLKPADYTLRVREIGGFDLSNTPRSERLEPPVLPQVIPLLFHGNRRERLFEGPAVALSFHRLLHRDSGAPRFASARELRAAFGLAEGANIVLSGTDQDPPLERWWRFGADRPSIIAALRGLGISLVTAPNYSLFADAPRWDDMHSMKRIALVTAEFLAGGLPAALHVNSRSERDAERWSEFVASRPEVTHLAYEFTTGAGRAGRDKLHAHWLAHIAGHAGRPLTLVVRGGSDVLPALSASFAELVIIESSAFMKTMKRQKAVLAGNASLRWEHVPTAADAALDDLLHHNVRLCSDALRHLAAREGGVPSRVDAA